MTPTYTNKTTLKVLSQSSWMPFATALLTYSMSLQLIIQGMLGDSVMAGQIGMIQASFAATFFILSGDARNLILGRGASDALAWFVRFRFRVLPLTTLCSLLLSILMIGNSFTLILLFALRKSAEWIGQLGLSARERDEDFRFCRKYVLLDAGTLVFGCLMQVIFQVTIELAMLAWSLIPIVAASGIKPLPSKSERPKMKDMFPFMGSTVAIGASTILVRLLVERSLGIEVAGELFTCFAVAAIVPTIFGNLIWPSILHRNKESIYGALRSATNIKVLSAFFLLLTGLFVLFSEAAIYFGQWSEEFLLCLKTSLSGALIMFVALLGRSFFLYRRASVFVEDTVANGLLIVFVLLSSIYLEGQWLFMMYLVSAILNFVVLIPRMVSLSSYREVSTIGLQTILGSLVLFTLTSSLF